MIRYTLESAETVWYIAWIEYTFGGFWEIVQYTSEIMDTNWYRGEWAPLCHGVPCARFEFSINSCYIGINFA